jgi:hypothetical protein
MHDRLLYVIERPFGRITSMPATGQNLTVGLRSKIAPKQTLKSEASPLSLQMESSHASSLPCGIRRHLLRSPTLIYDGRLVSAIFTNLQGRGSAYRSGSPQANTLSTSSLAFGREPCEPIVRRTLLVMGFAGRAELGAECEASSGRPFRKFDLVYLRTDQALGQFTRAGWKVSSDSPSPRVDRAKVPVGTLIREKVTQPG